MGPLYILLLGILGTLGTLVHGKCIHNTIRHLYHDQTHKVTTRRDTMWVPLRIEMLGEDHYVTDIATSIAAIYESALFVQEHDPITVRACNSQTQITTSSHIAVTVTNSSLHCTAGVVAYAAACVLDQDSNRPLSSILNICDTGASDEALRIVIYHELAHALGFSKSILDKGQYVADRIEGPNAQLYARSHFGCPAALGVALSADGSHPHRRYYRDDVMAPVLDRTPRITNLSMAILADLPFYRSAEVAGVERGV